MSGNGARNDAVVGGAAERRQSGLRVADFDFELPAELIAQQPPEVRGASRMLGMDRGTGGVRDDVFASLPKLLRAGDLVVLNDSRVIPARLYARRTTVREKQEATAVIEVLLTEPAGEGEWRALVRPGKKVGVGDRLEFLSAAGAGGVAEKVELEAEVVERGEFGERLLRFAPVEDFFAVLERIGHMPLPPYIRREDVGEDRARYQTVFAEERGSVAAPTAGLHFTEEMIGRLAAMGVEMARVTLHVGLGTFAPLRVERVDEVRLHRERFAISEETAAAVNRARIEGRRIVAVGTTVVRTLESAAARASLEQRGGGEIEPGEGTTEIFIAPGFEFKVVGAMVTNFHLPQSSLLMLVSAFAGRERVLAAYRHAVLEKYRFFSYGDCVFVA
jgi:S-adenosylmethionine:tRNA ribosyltransferase-isomerase